MTAYETARAWLAFLIDHPDKSVTAAEYRAMHRPAMPATVNGIYVNGQSVWYCERCAKTCESVGMFTRAATNAD